MGNICNAMRDGVRDVKYEAVYCIANIVVFFKDLGQIRRMFNQYEVES